MAKKILIVEDYEDARSFMKFVVERYGYNVVEAANGQEAVETVKHESPDLILMDLAMPVMDGFTATRIIRNFEGMEEIPIIAVTAYGNSCYKQAMEAGCNYLIDKPINFDTLKPVINQYLTT
ncbi:MAG TPA: response regulator [Pyrinomonadaceae bacterium]|jgi:CheY-like chemotaxis protein